MERYSQTILLWRNHIYKFSKSRLVSLMKEWDFQYLVMLMCMWIWVMNGENVWDCLWNMSMKSNHSLLEPWWATIKPSELNLSKNKLGGYSPCKETAFLWSIYHCAVEVNKWRHRAFAQISELCSCCNLGEHKSILHCFFTCKMAMHALNYAMTVLHIVALLPVYLMLLPTLSWE